MHKSKALAFIAGGLAALTYVLPFDYGQTHHESASYRWGFEHPEAHVFIVLLVGISVTLILGDLSKPAGVWRRSICRLFCVFAFLMYMVACPVMAFDWDLSYGFYVQLIANVLLMMSIQEAARVEMNKS